MNNSFQKGTDTDQKEYSYTEMVQLIRDNKEFGKLSVINNGNKVSIEIFIRIDTDEDYKFPIKVSEDGKAISINIDNGFDMCIFRGLLNYLNDNYNKKE
jgi:hypothetical protein